MIRPRSTPARLSFRALTVSAALGLALLAVAFLPAAAGAAPMYWGGTIKGDVYGIPGEAPTSAAVLERFERDAGKKITMVNTGQSWPNFDRATMDAAIAAGEIPLVTMPLEVSTAEVLNGSQDSRIRAWAQAAKEFGYPFLFRPWWEVNGDWYSWGRDPGYVAAWRHFHDLVEEVGATNVTWAWVVNTVWNEPASLPGQWYPGNEYVDWVGMDAYNWGKNPIQPDRWLTAEEAIQPTLEELERIAPGKPVCICESASTEQGEEGKEQSKAVWIHEMLDTYLPSHPSIKAYLWFNWDVEKDGIPGQKFDWAIETSAASEQAFREGIANPDYLSKVPTLTKLAKVPIPGGPVQAGEVAAGQTPPVAAPSGPAAPAAGPVVARVALGAPRLQPASGTAKLPLWIPAAGNLRISAAGGLVGVVPVRDAGRSSIFHQASGTERLMLQISASGAKLRQLVRRGQAKVTVLVRFAPHGGTPSVRRLQLTLRAQT